MQTFEPRFITETWTSSRRRLAVAMLVGVVSAVASCSSEQEPSETTDTTAGVEELQAHVEDLEKQVADKELALAEARENLAELRDDKERLEKQLPRPREVTRGDSHWQISFRYLTEERGVDPVEARRQLARAALVDPIVEGFEIWNFYDGQHFGTFPIQDEAKISPGALLRARAEEAKEERTRLATQVSDLKRELSTEKARLEHRIAQLEDQVSVGNEENAALRTHIDSLRQHHDALRSRIARLEEHLSSVHYVAGTRTQLRAEGKVEQTFLSLGGTRLGNLSSEDFDRRIDLREKSSIDLRADDFGVARIDDVELLPSRWKEDSDYRVSIADNGQSATLELLDADRFRLETLVILVSS